MALAVMGAQPEAVTIEGAQFYPLPDADGRQFYWIRQSNIPDTLRKHSIEWWMGNIERTEWSDRMLSLADQQSVDGMLPASALLEAVGAINKTKLFGYQSRDAKGDFGTNAHSWLNWRLVGGKEPVRLAGVQVATAPAEAWITEHRVKPRHVEYVVYDEKSGVAGRTDIIADVDDILCVCDWKTGKIADDKTGEVYMEPKMQNHLYRRAASTMNGHRTKGGWLLKLPRNEHERFCAHPIPWDQRVMDLYDATVLTWRALRVAQGKFAGGYR